MGKKSKYFIKKILVNVLKRKREENLPFYQNRMKKLSNYSLSIL